MIEPAARDGGRLAALRRTRLLDTGAEEAFARLCRLASRAVAAPVAVVAVVDGERQVFKGAVGLGDVHGRPLEIGVCSAAVASGDPLIVEDFTAHPEHPGGGLVAEHGLRSCVALPVILGERVVGTLCVADRRPRSWTADDLEAIRDVGAAVTAEVERREAQADRARYGELVEDLDAIAWEFDLEAWRFTFVNQRAEAILGYPVRRWLEEHEFWERHVLHPDDRDWAIAFCAAATKRGRNHEFDYRAVAADGRIVWLKDRVRVVTDQTGHPRLLRGVMVDITEERRAAETLRETEEKFRQIAENVREVFWIFDAGFTETVYVSPAYEQLWGRSVESLYDDPRSFAAAVHPEDRHGIMHAMSAVAEAPLHGIEYRVIRPDGTLRWAFSRGYPVRDAEGNVYRVAGTTTDITARKEAQERVEAAEARYRSLFENAPYAIYALGADGCFLELNPAGEQILELEPGAAIGRHFSTAIAPQSLQVATEGFQRVISGEADHIEFDEWVVQASGGQRLVRVTESALWEDGAIVGTHGVARDITGEYAKDRQLRRAERLATIGTLIGGVAHELNNPLQSISSFASLLLEAARSGEEREDLETIQREALRASRIVSNLRLLARQARDEPGQRVDLDLNDVVRHVLKTRRYGLEVGNVALDTDLADDLPPVHGDRGQLEQVVLNLVVNAEHALEGAAVRRLSVRTRATDIGLSLAISDTGVGIAPDQLEHIFDPFFTTKAPGEGTGLGLSLVYGIVSEHGGAVHVESQPGKGSTLRVELPRATCPEPRPAGAGEPTAPSRPLRVLIVDDEPAIRTALARYLTRRRGHTVTEAGDGEEALRLLAAAGEPYDVIVSDLRMPGLSGDQLLLRLAALGRGLDRRVVFLTGDAASGHAARLLAAADAPVLFKPIELAKVAERVEQHAEEVGRWRGAGRPNAAASQKPPGLPPGRG